MNEFFKTLICPQCGKEFPPAPQHVYKNQRRQLVCSYHCSNASYKEAQEKKKAARQRAEQRRKERKLNGENVERLPRYMKPVCVYNKDGELVARYPSISKTARGMGFDPKTISRICNGETNQPPNYTLKFEKDLEKTE